MSASAPPRPPAASRADPQRYRRNLRVYYFFMAATGFMIFLPIWMVYLHDARGLSISQISIFESVFWLTLVICEVPTGAVADRFGRRISLALGALLFAVATAIFALASTVPILFGSYLVLGIAMTLYSGASEALLYDTLRILGRTSEYERHHGRSQGLFWLMMILATAVGGPLSYAIGYSAAIIVSAAFFLVSAVAALLLREPPRRESEYAPDLLHAPPGGGRHTAHDQAVESTTERGGIPIFAEVVQGLRMVWRIRPVRFLIPFAALLIALFDMPRFFTQLWVRVEHSLDPMTSLSEGVLFSAALIPAYLGTMLGMLAAAWLIGRLGERRSFPAIMLYGAIMLIPLMIWNHLGMLGVIFLVSIAQAAIRPIATGYINRRITSDQRATVLSIFSLAGGLAMSGMLVTSGPIIDQVSFQAGIGALPLLVCATLGVALWLLWRAAHRRDQAERLRRWSLSITKPQSHPPAPNGTHPASSNGRNADAAALFPNVQKHG